MGLGEGGKTVPLPALDWHLHHLLAWEPGSLLYLVYPNAEGFLSAMEGMAGLWLVPGIFIFSRTYK